MLRARALHTHFSLYSGVPASYARYYDATARRPGAETDAEFLAPNMPTLSQNRSQVNCGLQRLLHNSQARLHFSGRVPQHDPHVVRIPRENNQIRTGFAAYFQGSENPQRCLFTKALLREPLFQLTNTIFLGEGVPHSK